MQMKEKTPNHGTGQTLGNEIKVVKLPSNSSTERAFVTMKQELQRDIKCCTHKAALAASYPTNDQSVMDYYLGIADVLHFVEKRIEV
ncbi:hypothetical protein PWO95_01960 [Weissella paramesenteroides]|uniref:hypothetical protein n=1 Tax=Weissella paramesenteroides TaxID=1249 RepID=UPI0023A9EDA2|nr:hypothetical protein [Weissella paramesenteroides]WEA53343.1 hypothetical protein PWO95_01960 [Weissella paramesenteroides]